ncbi:MAG TPA: thiamine phosphate synthase, partial [Polyangiaceae bacterium]
APDARSLVGERRLLSRACHDPERVADHACDLVVLSPIVAARKGNAPLGVEALARARRRLALAPQPPLLFALGGVSAETAAACLRAGADGVAVIGAALADDPLPLLLAIGIERKS